MWLSQKRIEISPGPSFPKRGSSIHPALSLPPRVRARLAKGGEGRGKWERVIRGLFSLTFTYVNNYDE